MAIQEVTEAAAAFRAAIEQSDDLELPTLQEFPYGACGDTCELLGQRLRAMGLGEWTYVGGLSSDHSRTHAWLERDGWIVDITADQFEGIQDSVIVVRSSPWHDQWMRLAGSHIAGLEWEGPAKAAAVRDYGRLQARVS
jgi:hypothetical protein